MSELWAFEEQRDYNDLRESELYKEKLDELVDLIWERVEEQPEIASHLMDEAFRVALILTIIYEVEEGLQQQDILHAAALYDLRDENNMVHLENMTVDVSPLINLSDDVAEKLGVVEYEGDEDCSVTNFVQEASDN